MFEQYGGLQGFLAATQQQHPVATRRCLKV